MVLGWLDQKSTLRRGTELPGWLRSWIFPFGMTESFGLASILARDGARVTVFKERPDFRMRPASGSGPDPFMTAFGLVAGVWARRRKAQALRRGVRLIVGPVTIGTIATQLQVGLPVIAMVDQGAYAPDPSWPNGVLHWVVVTFANESQVVFHDPDLGPNQQVAAAIFEKALDVRNQGLDSQIVVAERGATLTDRGK